MGQIAATKTKSTSINSAERNSLPARNCRPHAKQHEAAANPAAQIAVSLSSGDHAILQYDTSGSTDRVPHVTVTVFKGRVGSRLKNHWQEIVQMRAPLVVKSVEGRYFTLSDMDLYNLEMKGSELTIPRGYFPTIWVDPNEGVISPAQEWIDEP
jgi:hypothetical protein